MENLINKLIQDIQNNKIVESAAKNLAFKYRDDAMNATKVLLEHGQVNLHKLYVSLLNELEKTINQKFPAE